MCLAKMCNWQQPNLYLFLCFFIDLLVKTGVSATVHKGYPEKIQP